MTGMKMAEKPAPGGKHRHALRDTFLMTGSASAVIAAAVTMLNQSPPRQEPGFSPMMGIAIVIGGLIGLAALMVFCMKRTDEHAMTANL